MQRKWRKDLNDQQKQRLEALEEDEKRLEVVKAEIAKLYRISVTNKQRAERRGG